MSEPQLKNQDKAGAKSSDKAPAPEVHVHKPSNIRPGAGRSSERFGYCKERNEEDLLVALEKANAESVISIYHGGVFFVAWYNKRKE